MEYRIQFTNRAEKSFTRLPVKTRLRIEIALENLTIDPFHHHDVRKVKVCPPDKPRYRMRIVEYRVISRIIHSRLIICVVAVGKKKIMNINQIIQNQCPSINPEFFSRCDSSFLILMISSLKPGKVLVIIPQMSS
jgi:mRNA interferase RelE/StbE